MRAHKTFDYVQVTLTAKQERFVQEYLIDLNAAAAAKRAGYSKKTSRSIGAENLTKPDIQAAIKAAIQYRSQRTDIMACNVLRELAMIAFSDIGQIMDFTAVEPILRPASEITEAARRTLVSVKVKRFVEGSGENAREVEVIEFKLADKLAALVSCGKHLGLFGNKIAVSGNDDPIEIVGIEVVTVSANSSPELWALPMV